MDLWLWLEGPCELGSIHLSFCLSVQKFSLDWLITFFLKLSMGLEAYVVLCVPEPDFLKKRFAPPLPPSPQMGQWFKIRVCWIYHKIQFFLHLVYKEGVYYLLYSCTNPMLEKNLVPGDMGKNVLCQSDCRISKSTLSLKQNNERVWFFARSYIFIEIRSWLKNIEMGMVKHGCGHFGYRTQTLTVSQEGINRINWLFVCW